MNIIVLDNPLEIMDPLKFYVVEHNAIRKALAKIDSAFGEKWREDPVWEVWCCPFPFVIHTLSYFTLNLSSLLSRAPPILIV